MAITTLIGTSWLLSSAGIEAAQTAYGDSQIRIAFTSNNTFYPLLNCYENFGETYLLFGGTEVYNTTDGFSYAAYTLIENISGGTDVQNATAISWLETAGTLLPGPLLTTDQELTSIADAIRARGGYPSSNLLEYPAGFVTGIENIPDFVPEILASITCSFTSSTFVVAGSDPNKPCIYGYVPEYFTYNAGIFTCVKPGTYSVKVYARGSYNNSGTAINCYWRFYKNSEIVASYTSGNIYRNVGATTAFSVTLAAGDTFKGECRNSTGTTTVTLSFIIY